MFPFSYPDQISWKLDIKNKSLNDIYSGRLRKKITKTLKDLPSSGLRITIEETTPAMLERFEILYRAHIGQKENPNMIDISTTILANTQSGKRYKAISIYENEVYLGSIIVNVSYSKRYSIALKTILPASQAKLPVNNSLIVDTYFIQWAIDNGIERLSYGRDALPYGENASLGLSTYKLIAGFQPFIPRTANKCDVDTPQTTEKMYFLWETPGTPVKNAVLFTGLSEEIYKEKYAPILNTEYFTTNIIEI